MRLIGVLILAAVSSAAPAMAQSAAILESLKDGDSSRVLVAAHRAAHDSAPENSQPAIERAIALGVDIVEIDIRVTRDGVPVLMHDATVDRTTNGTGAVSQMTFDEIAALRLVDASDQATSLSVPTLIEALATAKGRILVDLDLKTRDVEPILSRVIEAGMLDHALFFNGNFALIEKFRAIRPDVMPMPRAHSLETTLTAGMTFTPEVIHIDPSFNLDATRDAALASDSRLWINALGDADRLVAQGRAVEGLAPLLAHGASIIQTDRPAAVIAYLKAAGRR